MAHVSAQWPDQAVFDGWLTGPDDTARPVLERACGWVREHYVEDQTAGGEPLIDHSSEVVRILSGLNSDTETRLAALLLCLPEHQGRAIDPLHKVFGAEVGKLLQGTRALLRLGEVAREINQNSPADQFDQKEMLRKMLLAMAADLRIVLIRLASRLQTLRWHARIKTDFDASLAKETLDLYAPLANRLGIWQLKWEMEDLAFRFLEPERYREIARRLEEKRVEREEFISGSVDRLKDLLSQAGIDAVISGRPKHIYSIWNKMRNKAIDFSRLYDLRALRVIVGDERTCYAVLSMVHEHWYLVWCMSIGSLLLKSLTITLPGPSQMDTDPCIRSYKTSKGERSRFRSAHRRCMSLQSMAWPPTGATRKPVRVAVMSRPLIPTQSS